jgi:hypothetical protein
MLSPTGKISIALEVGARRLSKVKRRQVDAEN